MRNHLQRLISRVLGRRRPQPQPQAGDPWAWLYQAVDRPGTNRRDINGLRQNQVRFVLRDAARELQLTPWQTAVLARILQRRGVCKWLRARRAVIKLKHRMQRALRTIQQKLEQAKPGDDQEVWFLRGCAEATTFWREWLRDISKAPRNVLGADREDSKFVSALLKYARPVDKRDSNLRLQVQDGEKREAITQILVGAGYTVEAIHDTLLIYELRLEGRPPLALELQWLRRFYVAMQEEARCSTQVDAAVIRAANKRQVEE